MFSVLVRRVMLVRQVMMEVMGLLVMTVLLVTAEVPGLLATAVIPETQAITVQEETVETLVVLVMLAEQVLQVTLVEGAAAEAAAEADTQTLFLNQFSPEIPEVPETRPHQAATEEQAVVVTLPPHRFLQACRVTRVM